MNPDTPESPSTVPSTPAPAPAPTARAPASPTPPEAPRRSGSGGAWLSVGALLLAALALAAAGLTWQRLDFTRKELARRSQDDASQSAEARVVANQAQAEVKELQARLAVAEVKLSEVSLQKSQLEELMLTLSRSRDDNLVQDLESALRLAQQQTQLTGSVQPLLAALQAADARIGRAAQPRLNPVQRAIARDIQRIHSATVVDVPSVVERLDELVRHVDSWPVTNEVGPKVRLGVKRATPVTAGPSAQPDTDVSAKHLPPPATSTLPIASSEPVVNAWDEALQSWSRFWVKVWDDVTRSGRELVRVSRIDQPEAALLAPEQAFFLRENLKLRLLNARLGLLARQFGAAQDDLKSIDAALARHFDTTAEDVIAAQGTVTQLRAEMASTQLPRPEETLTALAMAAGGR
ncbi:MAG: uroporphyrinogen-III C-methyltransferase [Hydrogenophaga sp.]|nr:uroporphyrinogen-III C-methyltransferase [Hydrogenophaga sp.]